MGLIAFVVFVVPWVVLAVWLTRHPTALRLGLASTPWRPLTDFPPPLRDQQHEISPDNVRTNEGSPADGGDKHKPLVMP